MDEAEKKIRLEDAQIPGNKQIESKSKMMLVCQVLW